MATVKKSQNVRILETLKNTGKITAVDAQRRGIQNLRARICELRNDGENITSTNYTRRDGVTAVRYVLA
jgi:hypothetical protein